MGIEFLDFFNKLISGFGNLTAFVTVPLGTQFDDIAIEPFASMSILSLLGVGLVTTLGVLLVIHLVRLFVGG